MFYLCLDGEMFVNKDQMLIMFSLTVLALMVSPSPFFLPQPCSGNSTRERSAYVLRQPGAGKECPPTKETEPCKLNSNCFHYSYNITGKPKNSSHLLSFVVRVGKIIFFKQPASLQIGVPVSSVIERCVETASKLACWTVCAATANPLTSSCAKRLAV